MTRWMGIGSHMKMKQRLVPHITSVGAIADMEAELKHLRAQHGSVTRLRRRMKNAQLEAATYKRLLFEAAAVLEYVSRGKGFVGVEPYPDAVARRVLGAILEEAGNTRSASDG